MRVLPSLFVAVLGLLFSLFFVADVVSFVDPRAAYVTHSWRVSRGCVGSETWKSEVTYMYVILCEVYATELKHCGEVLVMSWRVGTGFMRCHAGLGPAEQP